MYQTSLQPIRNQGFYQLRSAQNATDEYDWDLFDRDGGSGSLADLDNWFDQGRQQRAQNASNTNPSVQDYSILDIEGSTRAMLSNQVDNYQWGTSSSPSVGEVDYLSALGDEALTRWNGLKDLGQAVWDGKITPSKIAASFLAERATDYVEMFMDPAAKIQNDFADVSDSLSRGINLVFSASNGDARSQAYLTAEGAQAAFDYFNPFGKVAREPLNNLPILVSF